jgi:chemotaxis protein histidine kinase CheA
MTSSAPALEFFVVEASGYIDGLDTLIASAGPAGPDREALVRLARSLRGNSMMYRQAGISRVASALERTARALRDGSLAWGPAPSAALVGAVDDLRILVRAVRAWGPADDERARARAADLDAMTPHGGGRRMTMPTPAGDAGYLAARAAAVAEALERAAANPADRTALASLLREARTMSGAAVLKEQPSLAEVVEAVEQAAQAIELAGAAPSADQLRLFRTAAGLLARASTELSAGRPLDVAVSAAVSPGRATRC